MGFGAVFIFFIGLPGFFIVEPNKAMVLLLFGDYKGTVKASGFFWVNPFMTKKKISLRVRNFENKPVKVNDKIGNPVMIGTIVVGKLTIRSSRLLMWMIMRILFIYNSDAGNSKNGWVISLR